MRLSDLTPDAVRDELCDLVAAHLARYVAPLSPLDAPESARTALREARALLEATPTGTLEAIHAAEAVERLRERASRTAFLALPESAQLRPTTLAQGARDLAVYALTGADAETTDPLVAAAYAADRVREVTIALDSSPWCPTATGGVDPVCGPVDAKEGWPTTGIGLACLAAWARVQLARGERLTTRELAAVADLTGPNALRALVSRGELKAGESGIAPREARRWLSGRGVPGVA